MDKLEIDIKELIRFVEERPVLWDKSHEDYKSRNLTVNTWRDVCRRLHEDYASFNDREQNEFNKLVVRKWTSVKDNWIRSHKKVLEQRLSGAGKAKKYVFYDQLAFLEKNIASKEIEPSYTVDNSESSKEFDIEPGTSSRNKQQSSPKATNNRKRKPDDTERSSFETSEDLSFFTVNRKRIPDDTERTFVETLKIPEDYHLSFFKGILPSLHRLNEDETLEFQMGVLNVLCNIKKARSTLQPQPTASQQDP